MERSSYQEKKNRILPVIVFSQFAGTSLWFAGNAILPSLQIELSLPPNALGHITSAVQIGFIAGTLLFALLTLSDRFSPSGLFLVCSLAGAMTNLGLYFFPPDLSLILILRFGTGFFLAGVYPVGMKIAADWHEKSLGKALGYLVGALVAGTAFPHLLKFLTHSLPWPYVLLFTSGLAVAGGFILWLLVPDGPYRRKSQAPDFTAFFVIFRNRTFRRSAFGYFGHMWELYTFWAFVPVLLANYQERHLETSFSVSLYTFLIIAGGSIACVTGGYLAQRYNSRVVARTALGLSLSCCLLSPVIFHIPVFFFLAFLIFWGMVVIADSPQLSTLVAQTAPKESVGTALTIVNCAGFAITIVSIQAITFISHWVDPQYLYTFLAIGPALGFISLRNNKPIT